MTGFNYLQMFKRNWWLIALAGLAALSIALAWSYRVQPVYRASAQYLVSPGPTLLGSRDQDLIDGIEALDRRSIVTTYAEVMSSGRIQRETAQVIGLTPDELSNYVVSTVVLPESTVLELAVEGPDPAMVALLANSIGQRAIEVIRELYVIFDVSVLDEALVPGAPIEPNPIRNAGLALVLGLALGTMLAFIREQTLPGSNLALAGPANYGLAAARSTYPGHPEKRLARELRLAGDRPVSLGLLQLSGLHTTSEPLPAPVIEKVLQQASEVVQEKLRSTDVLERWDETSFALLLPATSGAVALQRLEQIREALAQPLPVNGNGYTLNLDPHAGVATRQDGESIYTLIEQARTALAASYHNGVKSMLFSPSTEPAGVDKPVQQSS